MKTILAALLLSCTVSHAEWYRVQFVESYNTIRAAQAAGDAEPIVIRIRNLEKIEYIQPDPDKVLLGGVEAESLAKGILLNQLVWVDNRRPRRGPMSPMSIPPLSRSSPLPCMTIFPVSST